MRGGQSRALCSLLAICASAHAVDSQLASATFPLSIDRQPLAGALQQLARQCDVQVIFFSRVTEGLSSPSIDGDYTLAVAMDRLLAGSGLTFEVINPQTVEIRPVQARPTDRSGSRATRVASRASQASSESPSPLEEVVVVGLAEQLVATRIATPLSEIPQTISIVTREQMRQRNEFTLADVLEHAPGITAVRSTALDQDFYARGYKITAFHVDGGAAINPKLDPITLGVLFLGTPDLVEFDHVEILRGSDALFSGNTNPGGAISLVRKRPQRNFAVELNAAGGSWDDARVELDITGPIARDGALRGRVAAVYAHDGYFYGIDAHEKEKIFAALEYDFTDAATLTAGASYQWDEASAVGIGVPFYADGRDARFPRETALELDWPRYHSDLGGIYLQYRQQLAQEWALKVNASGWRNSVEFAQGDFGQQIDPVTNAMREPSAVFTHSPSVHEQGTVDVTLSGTLDWFGWREEVAVGGDFTRLEFRGDNDLYFSFGEPLRDPRAFDPHDYPDPRLTRLPDVRLKTTAVTDQYGMFASLRIYFDDAWSIVGGARISGDNRDAQLAVSSSLNFGGVEPLDARTNHVVTPYAGVMYALDRHYSLYASYADVYRTQARLLQRTPGNPLGPIRGVNVEAGVKGEWRNGALNGSLAVYQVEQSNQARDVARPPLGFDCCYRGISSKSKGLDLEFTGEAMPGWDVGAGYSYNLYEAALEELVTMTPKHLLKAWANVQLPGTLSRLQIGGSLHAQTETKRSRIYCPATTSQCIPVNAVQPGYAVFDLRAGFDIDPHWRVALSVNNVLDEVYYETVEVGAWYGEPRNWMLRIDGRY